MTICFKKKKIGEMIYTSWNFKSIWLHDSGGEQDKRDLKKNWIDLQNHVMFAVNLKNYALFSILDLNAG